MKKIYYLLFIVLLGFASSCTDDFEDMNTDDKNPAKVAGNGLFTNVQKDLADQVNRPNVNWNNHKLWAQYWTETTYTDEANYDLVNRNVPEQAFRAYYRRILKDLQEAAVLIGEEEVASDFEVDKINRLHIIEMLNVYAWQRLVDLFGMVPYTDALDIGNVYPVYDDGAAIYADLFTRLNAAINGLDVSGGSFGSADLYYGGNVANWKKFGNTLKVKMAINIADVQSANAKAAIEAAVASGCFESDADDCLMPYATSSPNFNQIYNDLVASGRDDYVPANTIVDYMNDLNDPRRDDYFTLDNTTGTYLGGDYGYSSPYAQHSHVAPLIVTPDFPGYILTYNELLFYLAEAAARTYSVGGTVESFYKDGITNSILSWGGTQEEVDAYLAQSSIAYATATGNWKEKVATQSWIASYLKGFVGWTTWRRLDYPIMNIAEAIDDLTEMPVRYTFPINEQTLNAVNYDAASLAIGGDALTTPIFWDMYDVNGVAY